jgi:hypothetical protein
MHRNGVRRPGNRRAHLADLTPFLPVFSLLSLQGREQARRLVPPITTAS